MIDTWYAHLSSKITNKLSKTQFSELHSLNLKIIETRIDEG